MIGDASCITSYGVYISSFIRFAMASCHLACFNARNKSLTAELYNKGVGIISFGIISFGKKAFSKFYRRQLELVSNFSNIKIGKKSC